jgi:hypothetical protein
MKTLVIATIVVLVVSGSAQAQQFPGSAEDQRMKADQQEQQWRQQQRDYENQMRLHALERQTEDQLFRQQQIEHEQEHRRMREREMDRGACAIGVRQGLDQQIFIQDCLAAGLKLQ